MVLVGYLMITQLNSAQLFVARPSRLWMIAIGVFLISISFVLYTNHAWEDWYTAYRSSKNLALGNGLVFTVGERVHSFTSPLGTLVPALLSFVTGNISDELVLWLYRIICCGLLSLTSVLLLRLAQATNMFNFSTAIMVWLFAIDAKIIDFSTNGMETSFMMIFLVSLVYVLLLPSTNFPLRVGLSCAGLMWARPDSFIYIAGLVLGGLLFMPISPPLKSRMDLSKQILGAGMVALLAYLPWILWTWYYFGTPIPHTIIAKGIYKLNWTSMTLLNELAGFPLAMVSGNTSIAQVFLPANAFFGGWGGDVLYLGNLLGLISACYWCVPRGRPLGRAVSFAVFLAHIYLSCVAAYVAAWYLPSVTVLSIVVIGQVVQQFAESVQCRAVCLKVFVACLVGLCMVSFVLTLAVGYQMKAQQEIIEEGNRKQIGLWLRANSSSPKDTVFVECLGYVGFYSQLKMYDFPGLSSPEVVAAWRQLKTNSFALLIGRLQPDWLVLRPNEIGAITSESPEMLETDYKPVKMFDVSDRIRDRVFIPGRQYLEYDQTFVVYHREINKHISVVAG